MKKTTNAFINTFPDDTLFYLGGILCKQGVYGPDEYTNKFMEDDTFRVSVKSGTCEILIPETPEEILIAELSWEGN